MYGEINDKGIDLDTYFRQKKRKGGALRKLISSKGSHEYKNNDPRRLPVSVSIWGEEIREKCRVTCELNFGLWGCNKFGVQFRDFLFRLVQGKLYLNNVLAHMGDNSPKCTFCMIREKRVLASLNIVEGDIRYANRLAVLSNENLTHLFWECTHVQTIVQQIFGWMLKNGNERNRIVLSKDSFFFGISCNSPALTRADVVWKHYVKFYFYRCRLTHNLPTFPASDLLLTFDCYPSYIKKEVSTR